MKILIVDDHAIVRDGLVRLLASNDDMVQKGLGWLLREAVKANPKETVTYVMTIRERAPRLVLRTACETLSAADRQRVLVQPKRPQGRGKA